MTAQTTIYTFARKEIVNAAEAALANWDFAVEPEYSQQMQDCLNDIIDGSDDIGSDDDYPAEWNKPAASREDALIDWLDMYARSH